MTMEQRIYNGEMIVSLINGVGKTEQPHTKETICVYIYNLTPYTKINSKWKKFKT